MACQLSKRFSNVPCTSTTGLGCAAVGEQATFAPGGDGVSAAAAAGKSASSVRVVAMTLRIGRTVRRVREVCATSERYID
jgi:hypothetical protein